MRRRRKARKPSAVPKGLRPRRDCLDCKGSGHRLAPPVHHPNGRTYANVYEPCPCKVVGLPARVPAVDQQSQAAGEPPGAREVEI